MTFFVDNNFEFSSLYKEAVEIFLQKFDTRIKRPAEIRRRGYACYYNDSDASVQDFRIKTDKTKHL